MFLAFRKKKLCGLCVLCGVYFFLARAGNGLQVADILWLS